MQGQNITSDAQQRSEHMAAENQPYALYQPRRRIILCFDGTGNKFQGTPADSNILKIYGMLDRNNGDKHYYQPGIGTYVNTRSISHTSRIARLNSWYQKAKDSAVGTSFDEHVMGAYKFLMQCYDDDDIFIFGFSRGAYVARFLAEMLEYVGLLSAGNQEMARFAWKAFAQWQEREDNTDEEKKKKREMLEYLKAFRVNSVPRFESAWLKRTKFPYTARSTAKVIRHAVSIDERRAKFRSDLISESKSADSNGQILDHGEGHGAAPGDKRMPRSGKTKSEGQDRFRRRSCIRPEPGNNKSMLRPDGVREGHLDPRRMTQTQLRPNSQTRNASRDADASSVASGTSVPSFQPGAHPDDDDEEYESSPQDIEELWFPGCHADLGGGWPPADNEEAPLSHGPLVWIVREAQRAGLEFNPEKMLEFHCCDEDYNIPSYGLDDGTRAQSEMPEIQITGSPTQKRPDIFKSPKSESLEPGWAAGLEPEKRGQSAFHKRLLNSFANGVLHDCLEFDNGLSVGSVLSWKMMEYLPFRRMDLRPDGSWKAIVLPLPMGETRDIPGNAWIHHSAIRRMEANDAYRPGNLIIGGGGRGVRKAPKELGIGEWQVLKGEGDTVGMTLVRKRPGPEKQNEKNSQNSQRNIGSRPISNGN